MPETDDGGFIVQIRAPSESSLEYTRLKAAQVAEITQRLPEHRYTQTTVGTSGNITRAQVFVPLGAGERSEAFCQEVATEIRSQVKSNRCRIYRQCRSEWRRW